MSRIIRRGLPLLLAVLISMPFSACSRAILEVDTISQAELVSQMQLNQPPLILDVRTQREYNAGHIPGAINIEFRELKKRIGEIENHRDNPVVVYCEHGIRARVAESTLKQANFQLIFYLEGDMSAWRNNSLPIDFN